MNLVVDLDWSCRIARETTMIGDVEQDLGVRIDIRGVVQSERQSEVRLCVASQVEPLETASSNVRVVQRVEDLNLNTQRQDSQAQACCAHIGINTVELDREIVRIVHPGIKG